MTTQFYGTFLETILVALLTLRGQKKKQPPSKQVYPELQFFSSRGFIRL